MRTGQYHCLNKICVGPCLPPTGDISHLYVRPEPFPPDVAVCCPNKIDLHPNLRIPAGMYIGILPLIREVDGDTFKFCLRLDPKKAFHLGDKDIESLELVETSM